MNDALRASQMQTEDLRAVETRRRLREAIDQAIAEQIPDITVVQLCKIAGIGRSTFYTHFATIEDFVVAVIGDLFLDLSPLDTERRRMHELPRSEITRLSLEQLVQTLWSSRDMIAYVMAQPSGPAVRQRLVVNLATASRPTVLAERPDMSEEKLHLATRFTAGGVLQFVLTWLDDPLVSRADVVDGLLDLLPSWMSGR